jgi:hypothetical protein
MCTCVCVRAWCGVVCARVRVCVCACVRVQYHAMLLYEVLNNTITPAGHRVIVYLDVKRLVCVCVRACVFACVCVRWPATTPSSISTSTPLGLPHACVLDTGLAAVSESTCFRFKLDCATCRF